MHPRQMSKLYNIGSARNAALILMKRQVICKLQKALVKLDIGLFDKMILLRKQ